MNFCRTLGKVSFSTSLPTPNTRLYLVSSGTQLDVLSRQLSFISTNDVVDDANASNKRTDDQQIEKDSHKNDSVVNKSNEELKLPKREYFGSMVSIQDALNQTNG